MYERAVHLGSSSYLAPAQSKPTRKPPTQLRLQLPLRPLPTLGLAIPRCVRRITAAAVAAAAVAAPRIPQDQVEASGELHKWAKHRTMWDGSVRCKLPVVTHYNVTDGLLQPGRWGCSAVIFHIACDVWAVGVSVISRQLPQIARPCLGLFFRMHVPVTIRARAGSLTMQPWSSSRSLPYKLLSYQVSSSQSMCQR